MAEDTDPVTSTVVGGTLTSAKGGDIELDPSSPMDAPGGIQATDYGAAFGALEIIAYPESTIRVGGLEFLESAGLIDSLFGGDDGGGLFGVLGLLATPEAASRVDAGATRNVDGADDNHVTRRDILRASAVTGAVAGGTAGVAAAASGTQTRARFAVTENPAGTRIRVRDRAAETLPPDRTYYVYLDGKRYSDVQPATSDSYGDVLPEAKGTVTVGPSGAAGGVLTRLLGDKSQTYDGLTLSKPIGDAEPGEQLLISDNDILVDTIQQTGSAKTTCRINGVSIPHVHEDAGSDVGHYAISNGQLVYEVGTDPPGGETATITVYAGRVAELADDGKRRTN